MKRNILLFFILLSFLFSCKSYQKLSSSDDGQLEFQILQINDVYEIAPLGGGKIGGMARVAQLKKEMLAQNPNTIAVLAGDFLNPSVLGTLKLEGKRISGRQMVESMNAAAIDMVTFGNHEFDVKEHELQERLNESEFQWIGSNVLHQTDKGNLAFQANGKAVPEYIIRSFEDEDGTRIKVGFISATLNSNPKPYVYYEDYISETKRLYELVAPQVDVVLAITHLYLEQDMELAKHLQKVPLFMGGHEHHNMLVPVGSVNITKADANAKSAYLHTIHFNKGKVTVSSKLKKLDESIALEAKTNAIVQKWKSTSDTLFKRQGMNPDKIVTKLSKPIDAREIVVRSRVGTASTLITKAALAASPNADAAFVNTGSIRIDDVLEDQITEYDIIRLLPFGGAVYEVEMKGALLAKIIKIGRTENVGKGGFLAIENITYDQSTERVQVKGAAIDVDKTYKVALPAFLMTGLERNLDFLTPENPLIVAINKPSKTDIRRDIRLVVIDYLLNNEVVYID